MGALTAERTQNVCRSRCSMGERKNAKQEGAFKCHWKLAYELAFGVLCALRQALADIPLPSSEQWNPRNHWLKPCRVALAVPSAMETSRHQRIVCFGASVHSASA